MPRQFSILEAIRQQPSVTPPVIFSPGPVSQNLGIVPTPVEAPATPVAGEEAYGGINPWAAGLMGLLGSIRPLRPISAAMSGYYGADLARQDARQKALAEAARQRMLEGALGQLRGGPYGAISELLMTHPELLSTMGPPLLRSQTERERMESAERIEGARRTEKMAADEQQAKQQRALIGAREAAKRANRISDLERKRRLLKESLENMRSADPSIFTDAQWAALEAAANTGDVSRFGNMTQKATEETQSRLKTRMLRPSAETSVPVDYGDFGGE